MQTQEKDKLWKGLPAVFYKGKYVVFSPYSKQIITLTEKQLNDKKQIKQLKDLGFFGKPLKKEENDRLSVTLYLTPSCNLKCVYCFDDKRDASSCIKEKTESMTSDITTSQIKTIVNNFNKFIPGTKKPKLNLLFFGGEPTLKMKTIKETVNFCEKENLDVTYTISTNGVTSEENIKYMISKNFRFNIDCDGPPEIQDKQRLARGNFKSSTFIEKIIKILVKHNAKVRTKVVVMQESIENMPKTVEYLADQGIHHMRMEPIIIDGRAETNKIKAVDIDKFVKYFLKASEKARELSKKYNRRIWVSNWAIKNLFEPRDYFCKFARGRRIATTPNGKIVCCIRSLHDNKKSPFVVGKIQNGELYLDKEKLNKLQNHSSEKIRECENCFAKYICSGGCYKENLENTGSFNHAYKLKCKFSKKLIRSLIIQMYEKSKK